MDVGSRDLKMLRYFYEFSVIFGEIGDIFGDNGGILQQKVRFAILFYWILIFNELPYDWRV